MKKPITQRGKSKPDDHHSNSGEHSLPGGHRHQRFPTAEELDALFGDEVRGVIDAELAVIANERHLLRSARHGIGTHVRPWSLVVGPLPSDLVVADPIAALGLLTAPSRTEIVAATQALRYPRVNHRTLIGSEQNRFNGALQKAYQAGTYQQLATIHSQMALHRMHSMHGPVGTQRFLPWHRLYVLKCEEMLKSYEPLVRIPYWDYANDGERPDWVWQPPNVSRGTPDTAFSLPTQQTVDSIIQNNSTFTGFTAALEANAHNNVHNWCNGTITSIPTAAQDPIFWLLHANVDRIWNLWQATHNGVPLLSGTNAVLDPWGPTTSTDVDSIINLGYWYSGVAFSLGPFLGVEQ